MSAELLDGLILEGFAGPGGWSEALFQIGAKDVLGIDKDELACATALAAGHKRIQADVSMVDLRRFIDAVIGLVMSPPCQSFSNAGKQLGKLDRPRIMAHVARVLTAGRWTHYSREGWHDPRSPLVLEPLRYALGLRPKWIALEQVPPVLPLWVAIADVLRSTGYSVATGILTAEQYGVPQTRKRAFLVARLSGTALLPAPTHRKYRKGVAQHEGDPMLLPWVSMAQALGWGLPERPSPTITGGGTDAGGAEPIAHWDRYARFGNQPHSAVRSVDEPAATIRYGQRMNSLDWEVVTNNDSSLGGGRTERYHRAIDAPSPSITSSTRSWHLMNGAGASNTTVDPRPVDAPSQTITGKGTAEWIGERPATTICGTDGRITPPGRQIGDAVPPLLARAVLEAVAS